MKNKLLVAMIMLVVGCCTAFAGNPDRIGTAGAQELLIPMGSRGVAMGGAVVANSSGVDAIHWNPAGLANLYDGTEVMFCHLPYIADIDVEYVALGTHLEDFGTVGLSIKVVNIGDIEETTEISPEGTGRVFSPTLTVVGLSWAKPFTNNINFGFTGRLLRETIFEVAATGFAFDFGFTYVTRFEGLTLGFVMRNYGPDMRFTGKGFDDVYEDVGKRPMSADNAMFELPTSINVSASFDFMAEGPSQATITGNFRANNQANDYWQSGFEYAYDEKYFLRGGYKYSNQEGFIYGASFGAGLAYPIGSSTLTFEYTWAETESIFDNNQFFTVKAAF